MEVSFDSTVNLWPLPLKAYISFFKYVDICFSAHCSIYAFYLLSYSATLSNLFIT